MQNEGRLEAFLAAWNEQIRHWSSGPTTRRAQINVEIVDYH